MEFQFFAFLTVLFHVALTVFWIYMAIQALKALRQIASTLRRIAASQELAQQAEGRLEKRL